MTTCLEDAPLVTDSGNDDNEMDHWVCPCSPDLALCGADMTGRNWLDDLDDAACVVCQDLVESVCERCGE